VIFTPDLTPAYLASLTRLAGEAGARAKRVGEASFPAPIRRGLEMAE